MFLNCTVLKEKGIILNDTWNVFDKKFLKVIFQILNLIWQAKEIGRGKLAYICIINLLIIRKLRWCF